MCVVIKNHKSISKDHCLESNTRFYDCTFSSDPKLSSVLFYGSTFHNCVLSEEMLWSDFYHCDFVDCIYDGVQINTNPIKVIGLSMGFVLLDKSVLLSEEVLVSGKKGTTVTDHVLISDLTNTNFQHKKCIDVIMKTRNNS